MKVTAPSMDGEGEAIKGVLVRVDGEEIAFIRVPYAPRTR